MNLDISLWNIFCIIHASQKYYLKKIIAVKAEFHKYYVVFGIFLCEFWSIALPLREQLLWFCLLLSTLQYIGLFFSFSREMTSKENIHKRVFITLALKNRSRACCSLRLVAGREKTDPLKWRHVLDGEAVVLRTKQPMFPAPTPNP